LKKRRKKTFIMLEPGVSRTRSPELKVFLLLFLQKKKALAYSFAIRRIAGPPLRCKLGT
jgi:hypothetical protein